MDDFACFVERASMGPRPSDRGRRADYVSDRDRAATASMGPRPSDRGRLAYVVAAMGWETELQWVHGLLTVGDSRAGPPPAPLLYPLQWVHGLLTVGDLIAVTSRQSMP